MSACPFTPAEILLLESQLISRNRQRDRMLLVVGTNYAGQSEFIFAPTTNLTGQNSNRV